MPTGMQEWHRNQTQSRLGKRLKEARIEQQISQLTLAEMAQVTAPTISALENGTANPTLAILDRILLALKIELDFTPLRKEDW